MQNDRELGYGNFTRSFMKYLDSINDLPDFRPFLSPDRHDWLSVSSLPYFCSRKDSFLKKYPNKKERKSPRSRTILEIGTAVHTLMQTHLGKSGMLYGNWKCPVCGVVREGFYPDRQCECSAACEGPTKLIKIEHKSYYDGCIWKGGFKASDRNCTLCPRMVNWEFVESRVIIEDLKISGRYDGMIRLGKDYILEIKTIGTDNFRRIQTPKPDHMLQSRVYQHEEGKRLNKDLQGIIWYVDKGGEGKFNRPVKEFIIDPDPDQVLELYARVRAYRENEHRDSLPARKLCQSINDGRQRYCPVADICFDSSMDKLHGVHEE